MWAFFLLKHLYPFIFFFFSFSTSDKDKRFILLKRGSENGADLISAMYHSPPPPLFFLLVFSLARSHSLSPLSSSCLTSSLADWITTVMHVPNYLHPTPPHSSTTQATSYQQFTHTRSTMVQCVQITGICTYVEIINVNSSNWADPTTCFSPTDHKPHLISLRSLNTSCLSEWRWCNVLGDEKDCQAYGWKWKPNSIIRYERWEIWLQGRDGV